MFMSPSFESLKPQDGKLIVPRNGIANKLEIPESVLGHSLFDANLDEANDSIVLTGGQDVYILTDHVGLIGGDDEEVDANILFVEGGVLIQLITGRILLKGENGNIYSVDEYGDMEYPSLSTKMYWYSSKDLWDIISRVTQYRYTAPDDQVADYVNNLFFNVQMHYVRVQGKNTSGYVANIRVANYYEDIAMGRYVFVDYADVLKEEQEMEDHVDIADLDDIPLEGEEDEEFDEESVQDILDEEDHEDDF